MRRFSAPARGSHCGTRRWTAAARGAGRRRPRIPGRRCGPAPARGAGSICHERRHPRPPGLCPISRPAGPPRPRRPAALYSPNPHIRFERPRRAAPGRRFPPPRRAAPRAAFPRAGARRAGRRRGRAGPLGPALPYARSAALYQSPLTSPADRRGACRPAPRRAPGARAIEAPRARGSGARALAPQPAAAPLDSFFGCCSHLDRSQLFLCLLPLLAHSRAGAHNRARPARGGAIAPPRRAGRRRPARAGEGRGPRGAAAARRRRPPRGAARVRRRKPDTRNRRGRPQHGNGGRTGATRRNARARGRFLAAGARRAPRGAGAPYSAAIPPHAHTHMRAHARSRKKRQPRARARKGAPLPTQRARARTRMRLPAAAPAVEILSLLTPAALPPKTLPPKRALPRRRATPRPRACARPAAPWPPPPPRAS